MNRRSFFTKLGLAAASFAILPAATTYGRKWVKTETMWIPNPAWESAPYEISYQLRMVDINKIYTELNFLPCRVRLNDSLFAKVYQAPA